MNMRYFANVTYKVVQNKSILHVCLQISPTIS